MQKQHHEMNCNVFAIAFAINELGFIKPMNKLVNKINQYFDHVKQYLAENPENLSKQIHLKI